jgi:hypothetical protein
MSTTIILNQKRKRLPSTSSCIEPITKKSYSSTSTIFDLKTFFNCQICQQQLRQPVILPCAKTICNSHIEELQINDLNLICPFDCSHGSHSIPKEGFMTDKTMQNMIDIRLNELDLISMFPDYKMCQNVLAEYESTLNKTDSIVKDNRMFFYDYFAELRTQVNLQIF